MFKIITIKCAFTIFRVINHISINNLQIKPIQTLIIVMAQQ